MSRALSTYVVYDCWSQQLWGVVDALSPQDACHEADINVGGKRHTYRLRRPAGAYRNITYRIAEVDDEMAGELVRLYGTPEGDKLGQKASYHGLLWAREGGFGISQYLNDKTSKQRVDGNWLYTPNLDGALWA